jgi:DNA adenine methylase
MPPVTTLIEPFVGGGALFFDLEPEAALLNDASTDLAEFYAAVREGDSGFRAALERLARDRERVATRAKDWSGAFSQAVAAARRNASESHAGLLATAGMTNGLELAAPGIEEILVKAVRSKIRRLLGLEQKHAKVFTPEELPAHFETALQGGYYTAVRDAYAPEDRSEQLAGFFFVRTLCYGSMFRYGKGGRFNIPYGGISYNRMDFAAKVERLFSDDVRGLLARAEVTALDFEEQLDRSRDRLTDGAFVFFDPPYDTEFSNYANLSFGRPEQKRLARVFADLPCPALLVIQRTDFIAGLYDDPRFIVEEYEKTYGYNVRGRNDRQATHLLIRNQQD